MAFNNENMVMPVSPMGGYGGGMGFGGDWTSWIIILLILGMGGFGGGWGMGMGGGLGIDFPWILNGQNRTDNLVSNGFQNAQLANQLSGIQSAVTSGFGDVQLGIAGVNQAICQTGNGITAAVTGAQNALTQQLYSGEIASLNRSFAEQTANTQGFSNLQGQLAQCCCDNRLATVQTQNVIQSEAAANRAAGSANTQAILDKLCQLELDGYKTQLSQAQAENLALRNQISQTEQNAFIAQGLNNEVDALYNRLSNCPVPSTPVYGRQPIFTCNGGCPNNGYGFA